MAVELKRCAFDPMLVKPKCLCKAVDFFKFLKSENLITTSWLFVYNFSKNLPPLKRFWVYQHRVKSVPFQFYSHLLLIIFIGTPCRGVCECNLVLRNIIQ